jgi:hypothetical protein
LQEVDLIDEQFIYEGNSLASEIISNHQHQIHKSGILTINQQLLSKVSPIFQVILLIVFLKMTLFYLMTEEVLGFIWLLLFMYHKQFILDVAQCLT